MNVNVVSFYCSNIENVSSVLLTSKNFILVLSSGGIVRQDSRRSAEGFGFQQFNSPIAIELLTHCACVVTPHTNIF